MTPPVFRDGLGNTWDADGHLLEAAGGPYAAQGDLWPPADDVRLAEAVAALNDMAPVVAWMRQSGGMWGHLQPIDVIRLHDALSYTVARASLACDGPGAIAFLLAVLLGVAEGVVLAGLAIGALAR
jgi:hypothetical protein